MTAYTVEETLGNALVAGPNLTGSASATSILQPQQKVILPANFFSVGKMLRITATGQLGNIVTTPGTLTLDVRFNAVIAFNGGAMQLSSTAHTALPFWLEILLTCRTIGNSTTANVIGQAKMTAQAVSATAVADSTTSHGVLLAPNTSPAVGTGFDSTVAQTIDLFATFSLSNANAITVQQYAVEAMN